MAYNTKNIKTDAGSLPIPQVWDATLDDYQPMTKEVAVESNACYGSDTITRPANTTAYAAGDVISTAGGEVLEFANFGAADDVICITQVSMMIAQNATPPGSAGYRVHFYNAAPTAIADSAAYNLPSGDRAKSLKFVDIGIPADNGDTVEVVASNVNLYIKLAGTSLYAIVNAKGTDTPTSAAVYTIEVWGVKM